MPKEFEFEDKLGDLIREYLDNGGNRDEVISALELKIMAMNEEEGDHE